MPTKSVALDRQSRLLLGGSMLDDRRMEGLTVAQTAEKHGVSQASAYRYMDAAVRAKNADSVEAYRDMERARLEEVDVEVTRSLALAEEMGRIGVLSESLDLIEKAVSIRDKALGRRLQISAQWCKLMGLDAPQRAEVHVTVETPADVELRALLQRQAETRQVEA